MICYEKIWWKPDPWKDLLCLKYFWIVDLNMLFSMVMKGPIFILWVFKENYIYFLRLKYYHYVSLFRYLVIFMVPKLATSNCCRGSALGYVPHMLLCFRLVALTLAFIQPSSISFWCLKVLQNLFKSHWSHTRSYLWNNSEVDCALMWIKWNSGESHLLVEDDSHIR